MEENRNGWWITILVIALIWVLFFHKQKYEGYTAEEWFNEYDYCEAELDSCKSALDEANSNIEDASYYQKQCAGR
jgi:hypothetical protein